MKHIKLWHQQRRKLAEPLIITLWFVAFAACVAGVLIGLLIAGLTTR